MADILDYTTTQAVRGALGLTDNELTDAFLLDQGIDVALSADLYTWLPDHEAIWLRSISAAATPEDLQAGRLLQLYSLWFCAATAADMWLAVPQRISDGKEDLRRFTNLDFEKLSESAKEKALYYRDELKKLLNPNYSSGPTLVGGVKPGYDPVTGLEQ